VQSAPVLGAIPHLSVGDEAEVRGDAKLVRGLISVAPGIIMRINCRRPITVIEFGRGKPGILLRMAQDTHAR